MKRVPYYVLLVMVFVVMACGTTSVANPEPTATPVKPSNTPAPTDTPVPTDTPTPTPTATPDITATAAVVATNSAANVLNELDKILGDTDIPYKDGHLVWQQTDPVKIEMQGPQATDQIRAIDENLSLKDFVINSEVVWNAKGVIICGAIFRSEADIAKGKKYEFYFYRLSGLPAYFIDVYENSVFLNSITKDKYSKELDTANGATNQFALVAQGNQFTVYLNGQRQGRFFDNSKQLSEGYFGFLAWQESGTGSCEFKNSWIWSLDK